MRAMERGTDGWKLTAARFSRERRTTLHERENRPRWAAGWTEAVIQTGMALTPFSPPCVITNLTLKHGTSFASIG